MGKRAWLNDEIASEYIPFLDSLSDSEEGKKQAELFNQTIRNSWSRRGLTELSQQQSLMDTTRRALKDHFGEDHFSLNYIKFSTDEYIELNDAKQGRVAERNEQVQFLDDPDAIVEKAIALLKSPEWSSIAAGLSVLTGRRSSELLSTAQFVKCSEWSVTFTGALKRQGETRILSLEIPTLAKADVVCEALANVRHQLPEAVGLDAETVNSKYGSAVIRACDRHFTDLVPARECKDNLYTHLFRSIYATIATFWYCPPKVNDVEFKAAIQGHYAIQGEKDPKRQRSLTASRHYSDYEIADSVIARYRGKRKGVKLDNDVVQIIDAFRERAQVPTEEPQRKRKMGSVRIWREDKVLLDDIFVRLGLDESLNQSGRMGELLQWVRAHLGEGKEAISSALPQQEENHELAITEPDETIPEIKRIQGELISETTARDDDKSETTVAVGSPDTVPNTCLPRATPLEIATETNPPRSGEITTLDWVAKIDRLLDVMTEFISFSTRSTIQPSTTAPTTAKVKATEEVKPKVTSDTAIQPRSRRNSPEAEQAIKGAIDAIIHHNDTNELHDLKWAISINAVKELVSDVTKSQRLVDKAIKERIAEIDAHHALHQIELKHNYRHKRKHKINEVISL